MYSDAYFKAGTSLQVRLIANHNVPVFMYSFEYAGNGSTNFSGEPGDHDLFFRYQPDLVRKQKSQRMV